MILVITDQLNLSFLLQHQGRFIHSVRTVTDALRVLRSHLSSIQGVVLDERLPSSRLVTGYMRVHAPGVELCSWQTAQRHSPWRQVKDDEGTTAFIRRTQEEHSRFVWELKKAQ